ncbi:MAG: cryptochrome/photolyase family protein, partial [Bacteroidota bacterium]
MTYHRLALILGDCLFPHHDALAPDEGTLFYMAEDRDLCTHFQYHKQKLVLFLSAMRSHRDVIRESWSVTYVQIDEQTDLSFEDKLAKVLDSHSQITELVTYEIEDRFFAERIEAFCENRGLTLAMAQSPKFISTREDFEAYDQKARRPFMAKYYEKQRQKLQVLVEADGSPVYGQWSFDEDNRKKLPKGVSIPSQPSAKPTDHTLAVTKTVSEMFSDHPGSLDNFNWATTRDQAVARLDLFLKERFDQFGPYEDAIDQQGVFLFHSVLSPYMNMGLLTPEEVVQ